MKFSSTVGGLEAMVLSNVDLDVQDSRFAVDVGLFGSVSLLFGDLLQSHRDRGAATGIIGNTGELTRDGHIRLESYLQRVLADKAGLETSALEVSNDEQRFLVGAQPGYAVVMTAQLDPEALFRNFYGSTIDPFVSTMIAITDPKVRGEPYLFDSA